MTTIPLRRDFFFPYLKQAPVALALERALECEIYLSCQFERPVLDLGCGEGIFAHILFGEKVDAAVDLNERELMRAREFNGYSEFLQCGGNAIPKRDGSFNTIFSNSVLEHIENLQPVLVECRRLLSESGRFYATVPTDCFEQNTVLNVLLTAIGLDTLALRYRKFFNRFWQHYHCYTPDSWGAVFEKSGFKVVRHQTYCPPPVGVFNDLLAPIAILSFFQKKVFNRWFIAPTLRTPLAAIWSRLYRPLLKVKSQGAKDGLVFFELKKS